MADEGSVHKRAGTVAHGVRRAGSPARTSPAARRAHGPAHSTAVLTCRPVKTRRPTLRTALAAVLLLALFAPARVPPAGGAVPPLLLPAKRDTTASSVSEPAPLLVPGGPNPGDSSHKSREALALEQYRSGLGLEDQHLPGPAIAAYRNAVRLDPKLRGAHYRMGVLFAAVGQHKVAVQEFAAEVALDPGNTPAGRELGVALAYAGDTANAVRQLELLVHRSARDTASWKALGFAYGLANRPADAERALRRALTLNPKDAAAWRDLGVVLAGQGRAREAREAYGKAIALAPRDGSALVNLGNLEAREKRHEAALDAYRKAEARDSGLVHAYAGEVSSLRALGREAEAGEVYRRWLAVTPDAPDTRMDAIRLYDSLGRPDIALELARDGVRANPRSGQAHLALAMALQSRGEIEGMLVEMRKASSLLPQPEQRERLRATIASMRARAPDSLRAIYVADSLAFEVPAPKAASADSARKR